RRATPGGAPATAAGRRRPPQRPRRDPPGPPRVRSPAAAGPGLRDPHRRPARAAGRRHAARGLPGRPGAGPRPLPGGDRAVPATGDTGPGRRAGLRAVGTAAPVGRGPRREPAAHRRRRLPEGLLSPGRRRRALAPGFRCDLTYPWGPTELFAFVLLEQAGLLRNP